MNAAFPASLPHPPFFRRRTSDISPRHPAGRSRITPSVCPAWPLPPPTADLRTLTDLLPGTFLFTVTKRSGPSISDVAGLKLLEARRRLSVVA